MNIAINGFGRIGRAFLRTLLADKKAAQRLKVVAINVGNSNLALIDHFFKYDSIYRTFDGNVNLNNDILNINNHVIKILAQQDAATLPWKSMNIDWVVEATGHFTTKETAEQHCHAGAKNVLITAPSNDADITILPGINDRAFNAQSHHLVSLGSCTSNAFGPILKILRDAFQLQYGMMTTIHSYTNDQVLLDVGHADPRRARAAALNIIPTKTGADKVMTKIFPDLTGKLSAQSIRVPTPAVSLIDFSFTSSRSLTTLELNAAFADAAHGSLRAILQYSDKPLVSSDFIGNEASCIIDGLLTQTIGNMGKIFGWYDNEYGYACRLKDFLCQQV